jgi:GTP-binding protein
VNDICVAAGLKRALVLIDSRHGIKDIDREIMTMLDEAAVSYHLVLTKATRTRRATLPRSRPRRQREALKRPAALPKCYHGQAKPGSASNG